MNIVPIPAFADNYIWCLHLANHKALVVDPGDARAVTTYLQANQLELAGILVTHHHFDHTGGVDALAAGTNVTVIGPAHSPFEGATQTVEGGEHLQLFGLNIDVLRVPGHTLDHIAYYIAEHDAIFCGDTLFSGGCGRVFEGTFEQMRASLESLRALPAATRIYCAHEYTAANLRFAVAVDPDNKALRQRVAEVSNLRAQNQPTLPSRLADECLSNPFLRWDDPAIIASAQQKEPIFTADDVFRVIRQWKDSF